MKLRLLKLCLIVTFVAAVLGGCTHFGKYSEPNDRRLISVMGFDSVGEKIRVVAEALEWSENEGTKPYLIAADGDTVHEGLSRLSAKSSRALSFTHCSALILGEDLTPQQIDDILKYCADEKKISLSAKVISTSKAEELLSLTTDTAVSTGFEISDITDQTAEKFGYAGHTALYEIITARMQTLNAYALPYFDEKDEKPSLQGLRVYVNDKHIAILNGEQSLSYAVLRNVFDGGEFFYKGRGYHLNSASVKIKADFENDMLLLEIFISSDPKNQELSLSVRELVNSFNTDIFGIANVIEARYSEIWNKVKDNYDGYYKNARITFNTDG